MTRLVHRLGFENFEEARRAARDAQDWGSPIYLMKNDPQPNSFRERLKSHLEQDVEAVHLAFGDMHEDQYTAIVERICAVKRIWLLGYRNSHFLAGYFRWQLIQVRGDVHILPSGGESLAEHLFDITPNDLLIVVGFRRRTFEVRQVLGWAERKKVPSLLIAPDCVGRHGSDLDDPLRNAGRRCLRPLCRRHVPFPFLEHGCGRQGRWKGPETIGEN